MHAYTLYICFFSVLNGQILSRCQHVNSYNEIGLMSLISIYTYPHVNYCTLLNSHQQSMKETDMQYNPFRGVRIRGAPSRGITTIHDKMSRVFLEISICE